MAIVKKWSGDGLSPGVVTSSTAGTGDSPFDLFNGDPGGTYPNVVASGPRSPQLEFPTANSKSAAPVWTLPTLTASAGRFYITTPTAWNSSSHAIMQLQSGSATLCARMGLSGSGSPGQLRLYNSSATQVAATSSNTLSLSTRYRVEWTLDQVAGVFTAKVFLGDDTTALATLNPASSYGTSLDRVIFGAYNTAVVPLMQFDDFAIADTADFIGPAGAAPPAAITVSPSGIATAETLGSPSVTTALQASPAGVATSETFGSPTATVAALPISASAVGIPTAEAFGTAVASWPVQAQASGLASQEAFGLPQAIIPITARPQGFAGATAFGSPLVTVQDLSQTANPAGIASAAAFGVPAAAYGGVTLKPSGIPSLEAFGTPRRDSVVVLHPQNLPSIGNVFGAPAIRTSITLAPAGMESEGTMGFPEAIRVALIVSPRAIDTQEFFGAPRAAGGSGAIPYEMDGAMASRRYSGRLSGLGTITQKPNRWEGTLG